MLAYLEHSKQMPPSGIYKQDESNLFEFNFDESRLRTRDRDITFGRASDGSGPRLMNPILFAITQS